LRLLRAKNKRKRESRMKTHMILDLDTGVDDSIALVYAALNPMIDLLGVTGTFGNVQTPVGVQNALNILSLVGREDVPVFTGALSSISSDVFNRHEVSALIHGENGVGQVTLPVSKRSAESESAVDFLIRMMKKYTDNLVIVTTGPLTNMAKVLMKEPSLKQWKGRVVSMGGALTVRGNVSHFAEANISQDPKAAKMVFESDIDTTIVPLDVTMRSRLTEKHAEVWKASGEAGTYLAKMLQYYIKNTLGTDETYVHDPSAVMYGIHPEYFTVLTSAITVEIEGVDEGRIVVDQTRLREANPTSKTCIQVQSEKVEAQLMELFN